MIINKEPAAVFGSLGEIAKAIIPVLVLGGMVVWDAKMVAAVMFLVSVAVSGLSTIFIRSATVTNDTANKQIEIAKASDVSRPNDQIIAQAAKETL